MSGKRTVGPVSSSSLNSDARATLSDLDRASKKSGKDRQRAGEKEDRNFKTMFKDARKEKQ